MNLSNSNNHSKTSAFKKFKRLLYKSCRSFSKMCKNNTHLNQFLVLLFDYLSNLNFLFSIEKLFENANVFE